MFAFGIANKPEVKFVDAYEFFCNVLAPEDEYPFIDDEDGSEAFARMLERQAEEAYFRNYGYEDALCEPDGLAINWHI